MLAQADNSSAQQAATDQVWIRNVGRRMAHLHRGPGADYALAPATIGDGRRRRIDRCHD
jgi:hypothetical protein